MLPFDKWFVVVLRRYSISQREKCQYKMRATVSLCAKRPNRISNFIFFSDTTHITRSVELIASSKKNRNERKMDESGQQSPKTREKRKMRASFARHVRQCVCVVFVCHFNKERMQGSSLIWCWRWWWWWWIAAAGFLSFAKQKLHRRSD